jgi:integrase
LKAVSKKRPAFTPADFEKLIAACLAKDEEDKPITKNGPQLIDYLRFLAYCGARCNEALRVKWSDVDLPGKLLCIGADGSSKNSKPRYVDLNADLEAHLQDMHSRRAPDTEWLFPSPQRGENDRPAKTLRESFNIVRQKAELGWVGFHDLRHYFASRAVMAGIDFKTIAEWLGHQDGGVLLCKVHSHLLDGHKREMARKLVFGLRVLEKNAA